MAVIDYTLGHPAIPSAGADRPFCVVDLEIDVAAADLETTTNQLLVVQFPPVAFIPNNGAAITVDTDDLEDTTTDLDVNIGFGDSDGVLDITTDAAVAWFQAASINNLSAVAGQGGFIDVGGKYLILDVDVVTAAAQAGSVRFGITYTQNVIKFT